MLSLQRLLNPMLLAPATEAGALAAISAAIENPGGAPAAPEGGGNADEGGEPGGAAGAAGGEGGGGASGGEPGAGAGEGAGAEPTADELAAAETLAKEANDKAGDGQAAGDPPVGHERDAKGRFVKKAAADPEGQKSTKPATTPEIDPATGKPKVAAPPKADHVNDPIPTELKGRTRERMESLVASTKELNTKLEAQTAELESGRELMGMIEATGAAPEFFARHMDVLSLMCSQDPADQIKAVGFLRAAADKLGQQLGEPAPGKDPLEGHADLLEEVDSGEITRKRAEELAKIRNRDAATERLRTEAGTRNTQAEVATQAREKVKSALNDLTAELRKKDGNETYDRKHKILVPMIKRLNGSLPPDKIVAAVREAYASIELGPAAAAPGNRAPAGTGGRQPARATQGAGGGSKVPTSPLEALEYGLEEHARATGAR